MNFSGLFGAWQSHGKTSVPLQPQHSRNRAVEGGPCDGLPSLNAADWGKLRLAGERVGDPWPIKAILSGRWCQERNCAGWVFAGPSWVPEVPPGKQVKCILCELKLKPSITRYILNPPNHFNFWNVLTAGPVFPYFLIPLFPSFPWCQGGHWGWASVRRLCPWNWMRWSNAAWCCGSGRISE